MPIAESSLALDHTWDGCRNVHEGAPRKYMLRRTGVPSPSWVYECQVLALHGGQRRTRRQRRDMGHSIGNRFKSPNIAFPAPSYLDLQRPAPRASWPHICPNFGRAALGDQLLHRPTPEHLVGSTVSYRIEWPFRCVLIVAKGRPPNIIGQIYGAIQEARGVGLWRSI